MKDLERGPEALLAAVVEQTIKDYQTGSKKQRQDAVALIKSEGFDWLWMHLKSNVHGMDDVHTAKSKILTTQINLNLKAYQTSRNIERGMLV